MLHGKTIAVVVPAYNERERIERTIRTIPAYVDEIVVVDDASEDGTAAIVRAMKDARVTLLVNERNLGVGAALARGFERAYTQHIDVAAVMAGDGQMDPQDLWRLVAPVARGEVAFVKGNRLRHPSAFRAMPFARWLGNHVLAALTRWTTGLSCSDSQCGYVALSRDAISRLDVATLWPRYGYPNDLLSRVARRGLTWREECVRPVYAGERSGIRLYHAIGVVPWVIVRAYFSRASTARSTAANVTFEKVETHGEELEARVAQS